MSRLPRDPGGDPRPLGERELEQLKRLLSDPFNYPPELWNWIKAKIEDDPPGIGWDAIIGFAFAVRSVAFPSGSSVWSPGDAKISTQAATHADPSGGTWYLADGSAIPVGEVDLIGIFGANLPDARGRGLWMVGTHADVNALTDNDGVALADRSPRHRTSMNDPGHGHNVFSGGGAGNAIGHGRSDGTDQGPQGARTTGITVGPGGSLPIDTPAYQVVGNLFYHS